MDRQAGYVGGASEKVEFTRPGTGPPLCPLVPAIHVFPVESDAGAGTVKKKKKA